ncbi:DUF5615 family PIN-like protein [Roseateles amylovorans]|uniref:DUF5615 family PIN-like protein n=1 Tax=Roseateles amylovorans TaxID=2978473 RepID=A0ABY6B7S8_9BURK|nr:DUF5615 family PIN-like protein [Roseateles amylovorans]UXH79266.1 DUF5615 family PIN-like protein [Roseateles amylovorans]
MIFKFLIDECLSPELVRIAVAAGHVESTCVRNRGWAGTKDYRLMQHVIAEDFTLVTGNSVDFRGHGPGQLGGEHAKVDLHAGLVCLNSERPLDLQLQLALFEVALSVLEDEKTDLINTALDIFHKDDDTVEWALYRIPQAQACTLH